MPRPIQKIIAGDLQKRIANFKRVPLQAGVSLTPGHDYWWFQEFGTAGRGSEAAQYGLSQKDFTPPRSVARHQPKGQTKYKISPDLKDKLFFFWKRLGDWVFVPGGVAAPRTGEGKQRKNWYPIRKPYVMHPGVRPKATLRRLLWVFRNDVRLALMNMARRKAVPTREEIATMLNKYLAQLEIGLRTQTPRYVQPPPPEGDFSPTDDNRHDAHEGGHLADAWRVDRFDETTTGASWVTGRKKR